MVYLLEEKRRMDGLLEAFRDVIREQDYFDIVYSEKIGYLRIIIQEHADDTVMRIGSYDELLESLIDDAIMEAYERLPDGREKTGLTLENMREVRSVLEAILERLGEDAEHGRQLMEEVFRRGI